MKDYTILHKSTIDKIGISKTGIFIFFLVFLSPPLFLAYLNQIELAVSLTLFFVFLILLNVVIILPSFLKIKYKLMITNDGIAFYLYRPTQGFGLPQYKRYHIKLSDIKKYIIKNQSLILYYQDANDFLSQIKKRKIKNIHLENLSKIKEILLQKIGNKNNAEFKQPILAWLLQNFHLTVILILIVGIFVAIIKNIFLR